MNGPFSITVLPDALLVNGRGLAKPESSATELAALLHQQLIGELTLYDRLDNDGWHAFLSLLAKSPEDTRAHRRRGQGVGGHRQQGDQADRDRLRRHPARARRRRRKRDVGSHPHGAQGRNDENEDGRRRRAAHHAEHDGARRRSGSPRAVRAAPAGRRQGQRRRFDPAAQVAARADARPRQLRRRAQARRTRFGVEQDGRRRGADVARHAADADHRSAAAAGRQRRRRAWTSPASCRRA